VERRRKPELDRAFGVVLRGLRHQAGLSQEALAFRCQLHPTYISMLERGIASPSLGALAVIAEALRKRPYSLVKAAEAAVDAPPNPAGTTS